MKDQIKHFGELRVELWTSEDEITQCQISAHNFKYSASLQFLFDHGFLTDENYEAEYPVSQNTIEQIHHFAERAGW